MSGIWRGTMFPRPKPKKQFSIPTRLCLRFKNEEEERVKAAGATSRGRIIEVVFTFRGEAIRPITAYMATRRAEILYLEGKQV
jgi:uncharacterized DUF497 family protein